MFLLLNEVPVLCWGHIQNYSADNEQTWHWWASFHLNMLLRFELRGLCPKGKVQFISALHIPINVAIMALQAELILPRRWKEDSRNKHVFYKINFKCSSLSLTETWSNKALTWSHVPVHLVKLRSVFTLLLALIWLLPTHSKIWPLHSKCRRSTLCD